MITFRELLNKIKGGRTPKRIIYDNIVYTYKAGQYLDKFCEPLNIEMTMQEAVFKKQIEVIEQ